MWRSSLLVVLLAIPASHAGAQSRIGVSVDQLDWLSGCWSQDEKEEGSVEQWMQPQGGAMLGMNRVVKDGRMVSFEFMRIEETRDGLLRFVAAPAGQATTAFWLTAIEDDSVTFENPEHDFPQRVIYRRVASDRLLGRIEASTDNGDVFVEFPMTRTACDQETGDER